MRWFLDLRLAAKLLVAFGTVTALTAIVGTVGISQINAVDRADTYMYTDLTVPLGKLGEARAATAVVQYHLLDATLPGYNDAQRTELLGTARAATDSLSAMLDDFEKQHLNAVNREAFAKSRAAFQAYLPVRDHVLALIAAHQLDSAQALVTDEGEKALDAVDLGTDELLGVTVAEAKATSDRNAALTGRAVLLMSVALGLAVVVALTIALLLSRRLGAQLKALGGRAEALQSQAMAALGRAADAMARGDVTQEVTAEVAELTVDSNDELGQLGRAVNRMIAQSRTTVASFGTARATLAGVVEETRSLIAAASAGRLDARGDATRFDGAYRDLVQGLNDTMDAVSTPIDEAAAVLERVAARDLSARMQGSYDGDFARVKTSINTAVSNLAEALSQVSSASEQVQSAATQITSGSQSLAEGSSEQAASLEEIASNLTELASMADQSAGNAREAATLSDETQRAVESGEADMTLLSATIEKIKTSSDQTSRIVKTIDEIAFQTNLLALNAAVEAARAGEAGRGFAVVADEVRSLAVRAAEAARQTADLIEESGRHAAEGVGANAKALTGIRQVVAQVAKVRGVVAEISAASEQQRHGVVQINSAVEQMNGVTQAVAANAEEAAAAAEELNSQAVTLRGMVGQFVLGGDDAPAPRERSRSLDQYRRGRSPSASSNSRIAAS